MLTVWGIAAGELCGLRLGLAVTLAAAMVDGFTQPPVLTASLLDFLVRWSATIVSLIWISWRKELLQTEYRRARLDPLTGLANRQAFFERCAAELSRVARSRRPLTVMLLDGDDFKSVNDRQGHARGDRALQQTARTLVAAVRPYDLVCRLGGDEFTILFPETAAGDAERIAGRVQKRLADALASEFAPLTFSIGVATAEPSAVPDPARCLAEADRVLYAAKRAGKNSIRCTEICPTPPSATPGNF